MSSAGGNEQELDALPSTAPTPEERVATSEWVVRVQAAADRLPPAKRTVFMLREVEGFSTAEVAGALGVSVAVVKQRLHRAKEEVRRTLKGNPALDLSEVFSFPARRCKRIIAAVLQCLRYGNEPIGAERRA
jgi:RNA polymerase sigma-70 factor (ECF subfamily)